MSDSSDEEFTNDWIYYADRKEWSDIQPLEQDDGDNPIVVIAYNPKFKDVYDYFRAIVSKSEKSLRALDLTKDAIKLNPANYTVWQYRREIIKELNLSLLDELDYSEEVINSNPKNYQVWHHRRVIVEWLNNPSKELQLTADILKLDAKNYHAWQHRQWAIKTYNLFGDELAFTDKLLSEDVRNNSAWNQRYFVLEHTGFTLEILQQEVMFTMNRIRYVRNNESSWNYLRGILQQGEGTLDQFQEVVDFCESSYDSGVTSPHLIAFLIDMYEEKCLRMYSDTQHPIDDHQHLSEKVLQLCNRMATDYDTIREKYWQYVGEHFQLKLTKAQQKCQQQPEQQQTNNYHNESNHQSMDNNRQQRDSSSATTMTTDDTSESRSSPV